MWTRVLKAGEDLCVWQYSKQGVFQVEKYLLLLDHFLQNQSQYCGCYTRALFQDGCPFTGSRSVMEELVLLLHGLHN